MKPSVAGVALLLFAALPLAAQQSLAKASLDAPAGPRRSSPPLPVASTVTRRLWAGGDVDVFSTPSPDGRLIAHTDWNTGDLAVRDLATGASRNLTDKGPWTKSVEFALFSAFSPDGRTIAYGWFNAQTSVFELRAMPTEGGQPRVLFDGLNFEYLAPLDWLPDGSGVVTGVTRKDKVNQLAVVPLDGGPLRVLKTFPGLDLPSAARVSPDGRFIAYSIAPRTDDAQQDIYLLPAGGGPETTLVKGASNDEVLGWTPAGDRLVFASDRNHTPGVWSIAVAGGAASGPATLVRGEMWRMLGLRLDRQGKLFYGVASGSKDVFIATMDPATGKLTSRPTPVTQHPGEQHLAPALSPDGKYLAYVTMGPSRDDRPGNSSVTIHSLQTGENRTIRPKVRALDYVTWTANGSALLFRAENEKGVNAALRFDLKSGELRTLLAPIGNRAVTSADGQILYYVPPPQNDLPSSKQQRRLIARDLGTGAERELFAAEPKSAPVGLRPSPDGRLIAFTTGALRLFVAGTAAGGGSARELFAGVDGLLIFPLGFSSDGGWVYFGQTPATEAPAQTLWRVRSSGGPPEQLETPPGDVRQMAIGADGRHIAYVAGDTSYELWTLDVAALTGGSPASPRRP